MAETTTGILTRAADIIEPRIEGTFAGRLHGAIKGPDHRCYQHLPGPIFVLLSSPILPLVRFRVPLADALTMTSAAVVRTARIKSRG
jgi:hypothetical protein